MTIQTASQMGDVLRDARSRRGLTQAGVAAALGVSRKWIVDVERGHDRAELGLVLGLAELLGLDLSVAGHEPIHRRADDPQIDLDDHLRRFRAP